MKISALLLPLCASLASAQTVHVEEARYLAPDGAGIDGNGAAVAFSAGRVAVGDPRASTPGRAYTFTTNAGLWQLASAVDTLDGMANDRFGTALALDGDTLVVGAPGSGDVFGNGPGAAYVFARTGSTWTQVQKFVPAAPVFQGLFGQAVALDGDTLVIGAPQTGAGQGGPGGEADVYVRVGATWVFQQKLVPAGLNPGARAGRALALQGDRIVLGAPIHSVNNVLQVGRAFVYERSGGTWSQVAVLDSPAPMNPGTFGYSVALDGGRIAVGAIGEPVPMDFQGRVHVFTGSGAGWSLEQTLIGSGTTVHNASFGASLALEGSRLLVGTPGRNNAAANAAGSLLLFEKSGPSWVETAEIHGSAASFNDQLGQGCALAGDLVLGAAPGGKDAYLWRLDPPTPWIYCTAKVASAGCLPSIGWSGTPSASSASPFLVTATQVVSQKFGILIYGKLYNQAPFLGGTLCIGSPILRTDLQTSGGSPSGTDCTGSYAFDFNAHIDSGDDPTLVAGKWVWSQYWYRDPLGSAGTGLSDALRFRILP